MSLNKAPLWLSALLVLGGCPDPTEDKPQLSEVTVTCKPATVPAGQSSQCTATATDQDGNPVQVPDYTWTSSNESVVTVDSSGKATTLAPGTAAISASATVRDITRQGQSSLTVTQPTRLSAVSVTCEPTSVSAGRLSQCTASATDQDGKPFPVSSYTWTSSDESVAQVGSTGRVSTFSTGSATVRASATADGITQQGESTVTVTQAQPTFHSTPITANETWRAADNPHVVSGLIEVGGASSPTLTLEEGVQLRFELDAELRVTSGALRALGTPEAPIFMTANQSVPIKGYWRGVVFAGGESASELNHVTLRDCGRNTGQSACLALNTLAAPVLRHVTVRNSGTAGVLVADDGSAFGAGSTLLSVSGSDGYAVRVGANQASTLPTGGTFTDNALNAVELLGHVSRSQTWPNPGIPYVVNAELHVRDSTTPPTLTLSAGTVLRFGPNSALLVGFAPPPEDVLHPGGLIVDGTVDAPVLFTADSANSQPGHWRGVHLTYHSSNPSRVSHATFEYAGATDGILGSKSNLSLYGETHTPGTLINNVVLQKSSDTGLSVFGALDPGSTGLTVRDNGGFAIQSEANAVYSLPTTGLTINGNGRDAVYLFPGLWHPQTWPNLGIPYVSEYWLELSAALTLLPGTEIRFAAAQGLSVGLEDGPGALIAMGTAEAPIRFVPDADTPTPGFWYGLHFWDAGGSRLDHVAVTHAGVQTTLGRGNVNVYRELGAFLTNSTLSDSAGCGVTRSDGSRTGSTAVTTDFTLATYNNTFVNNTGGAQCPN